MSATPPPNVQAAAAVVDGWLKQQERTNLTGDEIAKLSRRPSASIMSAASISRRCRGGKTRVKDRSAWMRAWQASAIAVPAVSRSMRSAIVFCALPPIARGRQLPTKPSPPLEMLERFHVEVSTYEAFVAALRLRADNLRVARNTLDDVAGVATGYCSKLLSNPPVKGLSLTTLGPVLTALGLRMILVADPDAIEKYRVRRQENQVRRGHSWENGQRPKKPGSRSHIKRGGSR
jgi:hypothetical protein